MKGHSITVKTKPCRFGWIFDKQQRIHCKLSSIKASLYRKIMQSTLNKKPVVVCNFERKCRKFNFAFHYGPAFQRFLLKTSK